MTDIEPPVDRADPSIDPVAPATGSALSPAPPPPPIDPPQPPPLTVPPVVPSTPVIPPPPGPVGRQSDRGRAVLRSLAAVLAAAVAGVGIGEVLLHTSYRNDTVASAAAASTATDSPAPAPSYGARSNGNHFGSLRDLLLPIPDGYEPGPDSGDLGNDTELDRKQLAARLQQALKDVPKKHRNEVKSAWQALHLRASGLRTYQVDTGDFMVELRLDQFNQHAVQAANALSGAVVDFSGAYRRGPAVSGHENARCVLPPLEPSAAIDYMTCFAAEGDLLVTMEVTGVAPLNKNKVVVLLQKQLDRLARPGAAI